MTAPDARQSDELRDEIARVICPGIYCESHVECLEDADAVLPVVTAWHEKAAEAQARARAAEELRAAANWLTNLCGPRPWEQLRTRADVLAADDRTDPA